MDGVQLDAFQDEGSPERAAPTSSTGSAGEVSEAATRAAPEPIDAASVTEDDRWSWYSEADEDDIVVEEQRRIAVYRNPKRSIVIREESPDGEREDHFIVLRDDDAAKALIARLQREIGARVR